MKRDNRTYQIKRILKKEYPDAKFSVRIEKFSMGESIEIITDLLPPQPKVPKEIVNDYNETTEFLKPWLGGCREIENNIRILLKDFWNVRRDLATGDILGGGNTYLGFDSMW